MESLTWRAKEFDQPERHPNWFISLWIFAVAFVIIAIILKNYLFGVFIVLAAGIINIYALRIPQEVDFELTQEYIKIGQRTYNLNGFISFWIFERKTGNVLFLSAKKGLKIDLEAPLSDINPEDVRILLSEVLREKERDESLIDAISDWLKF
jgi:hypothetical protein